MVLGKDIRIETDDDLNAYLVVRCSSCGRTPRKKIGALRPVLMITCLCGSMLSISSDDIRTAAERIDRLRQLIDKLENR